MFGLYVENVKLLLASLVRVDMYYPQSASRLLFPMCAVTVKMFSLVVPEIHLQAMTVTERLFVSCVTICVPSNQESSLVALSSRCADYLRNIRCNSVLL